ncbi:MAG: type II secretion system protein [Halothermotrichaceae bacterium]
MSIEKLAKEDDGFTLIELLVVILIISILVTLAGLRVWSQRTRAANRVDEANRKAFQNTASMYITENGLPTIDEKWDGSSGQNWEKYLQEWPENPKGTGSYTVTIKTTGEIVITPP